MAASHNVLSESLIGVRGADRPQASLPEVLHLLVEDRIDGFTALQSWQEHAWFAFLVQLAALAMRDQPDDAPLPGSADGWAAALRRLTNGSDDPWHLVCEDLDEPAFLQPPVPPALLKKRADSPDQIDLPVTSKNHDLKAARIAHPPPEHWLYTLVSLQTTQGFSGRGNYGIVRMNGGFGNRPYAAYVHDLRWGPRFVADLARVREVRHQVIEDFGYHPRGHALLWLLPWDGRSQIPLSECDPWFIEVCRPVRLVAADAGRVVARYGSTKAARVDSPATAGDVGDPWTPVERDSRKALTLGGAGWRYDLLVRLLLGDDLEGSSAMHPHGSAPTAFLGRALVRGKGTTEGFHERLVPIPGQVRSILTKPDARQQLAQRAEARLEHVEAAQRALAAGLRTFLAAGGQSASGEKRHHRWLDAFRKRIDEWFFPELWAAAEVQDREAADERWKDLLRDQATAELEDAFSTAPVPEARRLRAVASAELVFRGSLAKHLPSPTQEAT